jgi:cytosine/adenosine deaminase-related metal-dependent hydrolase
MNGKVSSAARRRLLVRVGALGLAGATGLFASGCAIRESSARPRASLPRGGEFVVRGAYVVSMDRAIGDLPEGDVHVRAGRIAAVAPRIDLPGVDTIDATGMIALPGFVETHWHLWNTIQKNMLRKGVEYFPLKSALVKHYEPEDFYRSDRLGLAEAIQGGITTVHNFAHNTRSPAHVDAELRALAESGLRGRYSYGWIDPIPDGEVMLATDVARVKREWFGASSPFGGRVDLGVAVRGPMYTARPVYAAEIDAARSLGLPVVMHIGQNRRRYTSAAQLRDEGLLDPSTLLVHGVVQTERDRESIARTGCSLSVSIQSELRGQEDGDIRNQVLLMVKERINICLSIDSTVLGSVSMFDAMALTWYLGIPWRDTPSAGLPLIDFRQCLEMATINGARALGIADRVGSLTPGKEADLILVRATDLNMVPMGEVDAALVRSATVANVDTVIASGRVRKFGGRLVEVDTETIRREAAAALFAVRKRAGGRFAPDTDQPRSY